MTSISGFRTQTKLLITLLSLFHLGSAGFYNDVCDHNVYCNVTAGLICVNGRCACSDGPLDNNYSYQLQYDFRRQLCVGKENSACIGTRRNPVPAEMKPVHCTEKLYCIQLPKMPLGIGSCQNVHQIFLHGAECDENLYCDAFRSLVCTNGTCACANERANTSPNYELVWDEELSNCVSGVGSTCIGTRLSPVQAGHKGIECVSGAECAEVEGQTPGVGICQTISGNSNSDAGSLQNRMMVITVGVFVLFAMLPYLY